MTVSQSLKAALAAIAFAAMVWSGGCSTAAPPPPPAPAPQPVADVQAAPSPAEWNVFPNFTTGNIDIYHNGVYYGSITADSPGNPPVPKKLPNEDQGAY